MARLAADSEPPVTEIKPLCDAWEPPEFMVSAPLRVMEPELTSTPTAGVATLSEAFVNAPPATVSSALPLALTALAAALLTTPPVLSWATPTFTVKAPLKLLLPDNASEPEPFLVKPPAPVMGFVLVNVPEPTLSVAVELAVMARLSSVMSLLVVSEPPAKVMPAPEAPKPVSLVTASVPPVMLVPVWLLTPCNASVPGPVLFTTPLPERLPLTVNVSPLPATDASTPTVVILTGAVTT